MSDFYLRVDASDGLVIAAELVRHGDRVYKRSRSITRHYTQMLQTKVKARASGRPGPNAPTGDYRRSIDIAFDDAGANFTGSVGTDKPQGRRLELGFVGEDSLGRSYHQPAYAHFGPALDDVAPRYAAALESAAMAA